MSTTTTPATTERERTDAGSEQPSADSGPAAADESSAGLPLDVVYGLLSNERRRWTLRFLQEEPETDLGELAEHIAAIENDKSVSALSSEERKRVYICLYQCHLPKLDDAGVIEFDEARKHIRVGENAEVLHRFLPADHLEEEADEGLAGAVTDVADRVSRHFPFAR